MTSAPPRIRPTTSPVRLQRRPEPASPPPATTAVRRYWYARLLFGLVWAVDAALKWLPGFRHDFLSMITMSAKGQPAWLAPFFHFWTHAISPAPGTFALLTAVAETAICLSLFFGLFQRAGFLLGIGFSLLIWAIGEGFGGPYHSGATDIGTAVIYAVVFVILLLAVPRATRAAAPSLDARIVDRLPWLAPLTFRTARRRAFQGA